VEADWEFEIGGDAPIVEARWLGFVDLRADPRRVTELTETHHLSALAAALVRLNAIDSPVWTSKVDVFTPESIDTDELDAPHGNASFAMACYIDLQLSSAQQRHSYSIVELFCKGLCNRLHAVLLRCCRIDLVIRRAHLPSEPDGFAVTAYLTACGSSETDAQAHLAESLLALVTTIVPPSQ
jgi:hypothetical protein